MKPLSVFCVLLAFTVVVAVSNSSAQSAPLNSPYALCIETNAEMRKAIEEVQGQPETARRFAQLITDDRICGCTKTQFDSDIAGGSRGTVERYLQANAQCVAKFVNAQFPAVCPVVYKEAVAANQNKLNTQETLAKLCSCATAQVKSRLTPEAIEHAWREGAKYANALATEMKKGTYKPGTVPPPKPSAFGLTRKGIGSCEKQYLDAAKQDTK